MQLPQYMPAAPAVMYAMRMAENRRLGWARLIYTPAREVAFTQESDAAPANTRTAVYDSAGAVRPTRRRPDAPLHLRHARRRTEAAETAFRRGRGAGRAGVPGPATYRTHPPRPHRGGPHAVPGPGRARRARPA